jgi:hypothetical protein
MIGLSVNTSRQTLRIYKRFTDQLHCLTAFLGIQQCTLLILDL